MLLDSSLSILHQFGKFFCGLPDKFAQMRRGGRDRVEIERRFGASQSPLVIQKEVWWFCAALAKYCFVDGVS